MEFGDCTGIKVGVQTGEPGGQRQWQRVLKQDKVGGRQEEARCFMAGGRDQVLVALPSSPDGDLCAAEGRCPERVSNSDVISVLFQE